MSIIRKLDFLRGKKFVLQLFSQNLSPCFMKAQIPQILKVSRVFFCLDIQFTFEARLPISKEEGVTYSLNMS